MGAGGGQSRIARRHLSSKPGPGPDWVRMPPGWAMSWGGCRGEGDGMTSTAAGGGVYEVGGRVVSLPCVVRDASAGTAMFEVGLDAGQRMVPDAFEVVESAPGLCQLVIAVIDYRDNDLGDYLEIGITFFVVPRGGLGEPGTYIYRLPVDQGFTCEAGRLIWGFPKSVEEITLDYAGDSVTASLSMDG